MENLKQRWNLFRKNEETVKLISFCKKYGFIFLILITVILCYNLRVTTAKLPSTEYWAKKNVYANLQDQIRKNIKQEYPNLPKQSVELEVQKTFNSFLSQNTVEINDHIKANANYIRSKFQDDYGYTYLLAIDPYYWARLADNVVDHGYYGDVKKIIRNEEWDWDTYMLAPIGRYIPLDSFHAYFEGYLYKMVSIFKKDIVPIHVYFYSPILLICLSIIPAYFIAKKLSGGSDIAGFFSALVIAIHPIILGRTIGGFADTDAYNIIFPLYILWMFLLSFDSKELKKKIFYGTLTGIFIGMFSIAWGGWYYLLGYIIVTCAIYMMYNIIINWNKFKIRQFYRNKDILNPIIEICIIVFFSALSLYLFKKDIHAIYSFLPGLIGFITIHDIKTVWPNVYTTVAEQREGTFMNAIMQLGGKFIFVLVIIGILATIYFSRKYKHKIDIKYFIVLSLWLFSTCWAATRGIRFILLSTPAYAIGFGVSIGLLVILLGKLLSSINMPEKLSVPLIVLFGLIVLGLVPYSTYGMYGLAKNTASELVPSMNDAWYETLKNIDKNAEQDAIINSWWDFGHWFKYIGNRPVTFDGTSQNEPMAHWIGKVLLTSDEDHAVGILRMLDCGSSMAARLLFDPDSTLPQQATDVAHSVEILNHITKESVTHEEAEQYLVSQGIDKNVIDEVLRRSKCYTPPANYLITSEDMVGKAGVWAHFGSWQFDRAQMYRDIQAKYRNNELDGITYLMTRFNLSNSTAKDYYYLLRNMQSKEANNWISPWPSFSSAYRACDEPINNTVMCSGNIIVNLDDMNVSFNNHMPLRSAISYNNSLYVTDYPFNPNEPDNYGIFYSHDSNHAIICDSMLVDSIFIRLHMDDGRTLDKFEKFSYNRSVMGDNIYVWKVIWSDI